MKENNKKEISEQLYALIEVPKGCNHKYEYNRETKIIFVKRTTHLCSPGNYGFICDKKGNSLAIEESGDDMDVICLGDPVVPICLIPIKIIGALQMTDNGEKDNKLLAVNVNDSRWGHLDDIQECWDFIEPTLAEISFFLSSCKDWKKKKDDPKNTIVEGWIGKREAYEILKKGISRYQNK